MCKDPACSEPGWCRKHYMERYMADYETARKQESCAIEGCLRPNHRRGWCAAHYQRWLKYDDPLGGGPSRVVRGTGNRWAYDEDRRAAHAKMSQVTGETKEYVKMIRNDPCVYCGAPCEHIDHIVPFSKGGETDWTNLAPTCAKCNLRKSTKSLLEFMMERR